MERLYSCFIITILLSIGNHGLMAQTQAPNRIAQELSGRKAQRNLEIPTLSILKKVIDPGAHARSASIVKASTLLVPDRYELRKIERDQPELVILSIPYQNETIELELYHRLPVTNDYTVYTSDGQTLTNSGTHYRGIIKGDQQSIASISVFKDEIIGVISSDTFGNLVIGKWNEGQGYHVLYQDKDLLLENEFVCQEVKLPENIKKAKHAPENNYDRAVAKCVRVYLETDYALYVNKGSSVPAVENFVSGFFNNVSTLYENEGLNIELSELFIWTNQDPYPTHSASAAMNQFKNQRPSFNGDLAHLVALGGQATGGIAYLDVLCSSAHAYGYSDIAPNYAQFPTYSWTVNVVAHEIGHNYGSPHTHACEWTVNGQTNQALDDCYATEGDCPPGPKPVNGGTIMSYCHVTSTGINFHNGFGPAPGDLIRERASVATCLQDCTGGGGGCNLAITNVQVNDATCNENNGVITVQISGASGIVTYDIGFGPQSSSTFNGVAPGEYTIIVKNGMNCQRTSTARVELVSNQPTIGATVTNATCTQSDGVIELSASDGVAPYIYKVGNKSQSSPVFLNLPSGNYTCRIEDNNGCSASKMVSIFNSEGPSLSSEYEHTSCGLENGQINLSANGGAHPYAYKLDNQSSSTGDFTNLSPGTYLAQVIDNNGCADNSNIVIQSSSALSASAEVQHTDCGLDNGTITVNAVGGTGSKIFSIGSGFQISNQFQNVAPGTYEVRVQDGADCLTSFNVTINSSKAFDATYQVEPTSCGLPNGRLEINVNGSAGPFEFKLGEASFGQTSIFEDLDAGQYQIEIKDAQSCIISEQIYVEASTLPTPAAKLERTHCGMDNGKISIEIENGIAPYQYRIHGLFQDQPDFNQLAPGVYTVIAKDAASCIDSIVVRIDSSEKVMANLEEVSTSCGLANGSITLRPLSGIAPFTYSINAESHQTDSIFSNLNAGNYYVQVSDADQCSWVDSTTIASSNAIYLNAIVNHTSCGLENGIIEIVATGGTGALTYSIADSFNQVNQYHSLAPANYKVQARDDENCVEDTLITIQSSTNPVIDPKLTHTRCGEDNGRIDLNANQGMEPYTYFVNGVVLDTSLVDRIKPAAYDILVQDALGCVDSSLITIQTSSAPVLEFDTKNADCYQANGSISLKAHFGMTPYLFSIGEALSADSIFKVDSGTYQVIVQDDDQCFDTALVEVGYDDRYIKPEVDSVLNLCRGDSLILDSGLDPGPDIYWLQNADTLSTNAVAVTVLDGGLIHIFVNHHDDCELIDSSLVILREKPSQNLVGTDTLCLGDIFSIAESDDMLTYQWNNDSVGSRVAFQYSDVYNLMVLNSYGCSIIKELDMTVIQPVLLETEGTTPNICPGDSVELAVDGAINYVWSSPSEDMSRILIPNPVVFPDEKAIYRVIGSNQCFADTVTFEVGIYENLNLITPDTVIIEGAPLELFVEGAIEVNWISPFLLSCDTCKSPIIRPEEPGIVDVRFKDDHACAWEGQIEIDIIPLEEVIPVLPNVITPNQDGQNDALIIGEIDLFSCVELKVLNQQGLTIYEDTQYQNDWNGEFDGKLLPEGVYFYLVTLFLDDRIFHLDSDLLIVRD